MALAILQRIRPAVPEKSAEIMKNTIFVIIRIPAVLSMPCTGSMQQAAASLPRRRLLRNISFTNHSARFFLMP